MRNPQLYEHCNLGLPGGQCLLSKYHLLVIPVWDPGILLSW
ncbi:MULTISPECIES: hypothetical protein [Wolbachia]|nr:MULTISPECIES: hypothetical protein [Wolbachia]